MAAGEIPIKYHPDNFPTSFRLFDGSTAYNQAPPTDLFGQFVLSGGDHHDDLPGTNWVVKKRGRPETTSDGPSYTTVGSWPYSGNRSATPGLD